MAVSDPFASAPEEAQQQQAPEAPQTAQEPTVTVSATKPVITSENGEHVVTLKGGSGYDAPWYVIHASGLDELEGLFNEEASRLAALFDRIQSAAKHFVKVGGGAEKVAAAGAPAQQQGAAPRAAQEAPGGEKRFCSHGEMRFRSGTSKAGKAYSGFFCGSGDRNNECPAQFLR